MRIVESQVDLGLWIWDCGFGTDLVGVNVSMTGSWLATGSTFSMPPGWIDWLTAMVVARVANFSVL